MLGLGLGLALRPENCGLGLGSHGLGLDTKGLGLDMQWPQMARPRLATSHHVNPSAFGCGLRLT